MSEDQAVNQSSIAFLGNYLPRKCGIATFTHDLCEAVARQAGSAADVFAVAMNDVPEGYHYPPRVRFEIRQNAQQDYRLAAEFLNINQVSAVCLQHEYGIFGGPFGVNLLNLLRRLRRPLVTTLHTVLKDPNEQQLKILEEVGRFSDRVVVMSDKAHDILNDVYSIAPEKVAKIHHGIPEVPFVDPNFHKDQFGVEGKKVILTFGLLSPGKGIEYAIQALPAVVAKHPDIVYIVLGATHPHVKRDHGEEYRNSLVRLADELGVSKNVMFVNRFVELNELCEFLGAADLYVTPYLNEIQITSGTLAYALGAGKATVSTPYWYAAEMLDEGRGRLVPFKDADAIARELNDLLDRETERHAMRKRAYSFTRQMIWPNVAQQYLDLFVEARDAWVHRKLTVVPVSEIQSQKALRSDALPELDLRHLRTLTDDTGIMQHAIYSTPDRREGYCVDDNVRALIVAATAWDQTRDESLLPLIQTYLSFTAHALDDETNRFRNFMSYDRKWIDEEGFGSEDSHGRTLWGVGMAAALCPHESMIGLATHLFMRGLSVVEEFTSPRAWAFTIVGLHGYLRRFGGDSDARRMRQVLAEKLADIFNQAAGDDWPWFEDYLTYCNAKLPHALLMSGKWTQRSDWIDLGKRSLQWLLDVQTNAEGRLSLVGNDGWYLRDGHRAQFDQQPLDAQALVDACIEAYHVTREEHWIIQARKVFNWFLGDNDLRIPLYDFTTGGCRDGLQVDRVNANQGAESTLAWLLSLLAMRELKTEQDLGQFTSDDQNPKPVARPLGASDVVSDEE
jgi:glycosyltransferase involved in cell wall biosynthesis